jgi:hypothetical protein
LAADELYDGPFCVLSAVDARRQRRLLYEVLDHDPTQADILWFLNSSRQQGKQNLNRSAGFGGLEEKNGLALW